MPDKEFLEWIQARLEHVHGEDKNIDYMRKLRAIIEGMDEFKCTPNVYYNY